MLHYLKAHKEAFSPEDVAILVDAFHKAWHSVPGHLDEGADATRELLANHIIESAKTGDLDKDRLAKNAVEYLAGTLLNTSRQLPPANDDATPNK
jgi:hypothetical protein